MPEPKPGETREEFIPRCIKETLADGATDDPKQAAAICYSKWREAGKSIDPANVTLSWVAPVVPLDDDVISYGGEVKTLGKTDKGVKVGGYLVRFSTANDPDLTGDFFTPDTDFDIELPGRSTTYFNHGLDAHFKRAKLEPVQLSRDEYGIWAEGLLQERDEYERMLVEMVEMGKIGFSSGVPGHLVEREPEGKAYRITSWPLGKDASYTATPAEPRNKVIPLKSLMTAPAAPPPVAEPIKKESPMEITEEQLKSYIAGAATAAVEEYRKTEPAVKAPQVTVTLDEADRPFQTLGENLKAIVNATKYGQMHPRLRALKHIEAQANIELKQLGLNEGIGSEGGFLVETDLQPGLLKEIHEQGPFMPRVRRIGISSNANGTVLNGLNETSRATGSRWGGMVAYWLGEHGTKLPAMPSFKQLHLRLKKVAALAYATDEVLADAAQLEAVVAEAAIGEMGFMVNDSILRGTGGIDPQGILASPSLVTVAIEAAQLNTTFVFENALNMYARRMMGHQYAWFVNPNVMPQLYAMNAAVGAGGQLVFMPPGGISGAPYGTLFGLPVIENEFSPTLGTAGDVGLFSLQDYILIEKGGIQAATSIHVAFLTDETCFRWVYRCDGMSAYAASITPFQSALPIGPWIVLAGRP